MSLNRQMDKVILIYLYNGLLLSNNNKTQVFIGNNTDGSQNNYAERAR